MILEGNLFGPDIGELISSSNNWAEIIMWCIFKGLKESLPSRWLYILGDGFENTGKKNQPASEQSGVNLRKNTKDLPILLNASEQCGLLFAVNSSSVMDCRPAQNKNILMIGLCSEVNNLKQYTHNLAQNTDSTEVNTENKNSGNDDFGFQTEGAYKGEDEVLLKFQWAEETERMGYNKFLESRDRREGKRGKLQVQSTE